MSSKLWFSELVSSMDERLKPLGFNRKRNTWTRDVNDVKQSISLVKSSSTQANFLRLYVDLGVGSYSFIQDRPAVPPGGTKWEGPANEWPKRLEGLPGPFNRNDWVAGSDEEAATMIKDLLAALETVGLPAMDEVNSSRNLLAYYEAAYKRSVFLGTAERIQRYKKSLGI